MASDIVGNAAEQKPLQAFPTMGADDNQIGMPFAGNINHRGPNMAQTHNTIGMSLQFAACAAAVVERAKAQGVGRELPGQWFTEDVHP